MNHKKITLDTERKSFESIIAMQGDNKSRYIIATIVNRSVQVDLTGCTVKFSAIKPDLTDIFNDAVIIDAKGGKVQIELTNQTLAKAGVVQATLVILKEDMQLSVLPFFITVIENPYNPNAIDFNYSVEILKQSWGDYRIKEQTKDYFIVESDRKDFTFKYVVTAKRRGFEDCRLEEHILIDSETEVIENSSADDNGLYDFKTKEAL